MISLNNEKGFTLVEVVVTLVVITIVMTPLLQMFVTSSYVNRDAQLMDAANIVAVRQAEAFKADQTLGVDPVQDQATYGSLSSPRITYYDRSGNLTGTTGAAIEVDSTLNSLSASPPNLSATAYYPDFICNLYSSQVTTDLDVQITSTSNTYEIDWRPSGTGSWIPLASNNNSTIINNTLPIEVDFPQGGTALTITLTNTSNAEAEFYIFNASSPSYVTFTPESLGSYSVSYVPDKISSSDTNPTDTEYDLVLNAYNRLNKDVNGNIVPAEMLTNSAKQYVHSN